MGGDRPLRPRGGRRRRAQPLRPEHKRSTSGGGRRARPPGRGAPGPERGFHQGCGARRGADAAGDRLQRSEGRDARGHVRRARGGRRRLRDGPRRGRRAAGDRRSRRRRRLCGPGAGGPLRRPRAGILHRPRLRGGADLPRHQRGRRAGALRLDRRRRALRRAGGALPRRAGAGDGLLDRRVAPALGAAAGGTAPSSRAPSRRRRSWCW